jgi:hypothetical protein
VHRGSITRCGRGTFPPGHHAPENSGFEQSFFSADRR